MVRAPCCEKMGLKKGPWTPEEDQILVSYIQRYGHGNWRALPKQAGLLRCGKSCRLRWINYLRPDIKRGNFTREEEETIINLHEKLGNRWSAIAARLPGRTDNEIKNVWHTHLKKRLNQGQAIPVTKRNTPKTAKSESDITRKSSESADSNVTAQPGGIESPGYASLSPQPSSSDMSSVSDATTTPTNTEKINMDIKVEQFDSWEEFPEIDESFWSDALSAVDSCTPSDFTGIMRNEFQQQFPFNSVDHAMENGYGYVPNIDDGMEFWYDLFIRAGDGQELAIFDELL